MDRPRGEAKDAPQPRLVDPAECQRELQRPALPTRGQVREKP
jgi:hypothetical protein